MFIKTDRDFNICPDGDFAIECEVVEEKGSTSTIEVDRGIYYDVSSVDIISDCDLPFPPGETPWPADSTGRSRVGHNL